MTKRRAVRRKQVSTVITLTKNIHLTIHGENPVNRLRKFVYRHHRLIFMCSMITVAVGFVFIHERSAAKITLASVAGELVQFVGDVLIDRLFPGGEFTKPV